MSHIHTEYMLEIRLYSVNVHCVDPILHAY